VRVGPQAGPSAEGFGPQAGPAERTPTAGPSARTLEMTATDPTPARYFPVQATPFRFRAGFHPFGTDFGNGPADRQFFQIDAQRERYRREKRRVNPARHRLLARDDAEGAVHALVLDWIQTTLAREHPGRCAPPLDSYREIAAQIQEDLVVMHRRDDGSDAAILVDVCFPSDWRPERIAGTDFRFIHGPVPGFAERPAEARALVRAMIERGPHIRFVWTLTADDELDHHPEEGRRIAWEATEQGYLRVERQVTVPFPFVNAALFLIRTYLYPFAELTGGQRGRIARALETMPEAAARYKGFLAARPAILRLLGVP
jgi:hypothetical protein